MRILDLTLKDLVQLARDRRVLLFLVAMPIVFTLFMGFAFRSAAQPVDARLALGWVTRDPQGALSQQLQANLTASDALRVVEIDAARPDIGSLVSKGDVAGMLSVPASFSGDALAGRPAQLRLIADSLSTRGQALAQLLRLQVTRLMSSAAVARLDVDTIAAQKPFASDADRQTELLAAFQAASHAWRGVTNNQKPSSKALPRAAAVRHLLATLITRLRPASWCSSPYLDW